MIASAIKVNVATAIPNENVTKLELYPSVTHITVVVFLSTVELLYPRQQTHGIMKSLGTKNYCDAVLALAGYQVISHRVRDIRKTFSKELKTNLV